MSIVLDLQYLCAAVLGYDGDGGGPSIQGILQEFLEGAGGFLDYLTRRDAIHYPRFESCDDGWTGNRHDE